MNLPLQAQTEDPEWRTWVSTDGAEIEAHLKEVLPDSIVIVRRDGREFTAPLERFSEKDRAYVTEWAKNQQPGAENFRALDFEKVEVPLNHEIGGVEYVRAGSREPPESAAVRMVLDFHKITYDASLTEQIKVREGRPEEIIPARDLTNALQSLSVETETIETDTQKSGDWKTNLNKIKKALSLDLPVIIGHRPEIEEETPEAIGVATGYDRRSLQVIDPTGGRRALPIDLRDLEESLVYAMILFPKLEATEPTPAQQAKATPEFLSRISTAIREVPSSKASDLMELLEERDIQATLQDVNKTDARNQLGRTRSFAQEGGVPQILSALDEGRVVVVPQEFDAGEGFALIYDRSGEDLAAVEFFPDKTFNRTTLSGSELAKRWVTREDGIHRLDLIQITVPPPAEKGNTPESPPPPPSGTPPGRPPPPPQ